MGWNIRNQTSYHWAQLVLWGQPLEAGNSALMPSDGTKLVHLHQANGVTGFGGWILWHLCGVKMGGWVRWVDRVCVSTVFDMLQNLWHWKLEALWIEQRVAWYPLVSTCTTILRKTGWTWVKMAPASLLTRSLWRILQAWPIRPMYIRVCWI